jgi:hypothetical protein
MLCVSLSQITNRNGLSAQKVGMKGRILGGLSLHALGFKRVGTQLAALGAAGVQLALKARRIVADPSGFMVTPQETERPASA